MQDFGPLESPELALRFAGQVIAPLNRGAERTGRH
jgi:hypothetical protein